MLMKENKKKFEKKILGDNLINYSIIIGYKEYIRMIYNIRLKPWVIIIIIIIINIIIIRCRL